MAIGPRDDRWRAQQRVRLDYTNLMETAIGSRGGISEAELRSLQPRVKEAVAWLQRLGHSDQAAWLDLPYQASVANRVVAAADDIAARSDAFVVLGIGGSALGAKALQTALLPARDPRSTAKQPNSRPRILVLDNVDPDFVSRSLDNLDLNRTVFDVVTKSGSTAETMAQLAIVLKRLRDAGVAKPENHIVATTDPSQGDLRKLAERHGWQSFDIPLSVGGRFSVLSPVGLLPAAVGGVDVRELLAGAAEADVYSRNGDLWTNPAALNAALLYLHYERGRHITVLMPYCQRLTDFADWFKQLWAESLGKTKRANGHVEHIGPTPVSALGVTDQHSQLQLYMEGPLDKVVEFIAVEHFRCAVEIPSLQLGLSSLDYLGGHSLNQLIDAEREGTAIAMRGAGRPNATLIVPEIRPFTIGQLIYLLEVQTALIGYLFGIDPFNQPGVEASKVATYALLGRPGYETRAAEIKGGYVGESRRIA